MKLNKIARWIYIALAIVAFGYSLGFFTNFVQISGADRKLYDLLQLFNHKIFGYSLFVMLSAGLVHVSHNLGNGIYRTVSVISGAVSLYLSYFIIKYLPFLKSSYLNVNLEDVQMYYPNYTMSTMTFDIGNVLFIAFAVITVLFVVSAFIKQEGAQ